LAGAAAGGCCAPAEAPHRRTKTIAIERFMQVA
jgi:hypothetical protein